MAAGAARPASVARAVRLAKYLAHAGVASRRGAERLVAQRRVTVAGEVVADPARDVDEASGVAVDGRPVGPEPVEVHLLNKPAGVVSTARDPHGRPTCTELVLREGRKRQVRRMCEAVGHRVVALERVAFGPLRLGRLAPGDSRRLSPAEVERVRRAGPGDRPDAVRRPRSPTGGRVSTRPGSAPSRSARGRPSRRSR